MCVGGGRVQFFHALKRKFVLDFTCHVLCGAVVLIVVVDTPPLLTSASNWISNLVIVGFDNKLGSMEDRNSRSVEGVR